MNEICLVRDSGFVSPQGRFFAATSAGGSKGKKKSGTTRYAVYEINH